MLVAGGTYAGQGISHDGSKSSANGLCRLTYNGDGTFTSHTSGCVTFEPAPGASVTIGARTTTTTDLDMTAETTVPVLSTAGFYPNWNTTGYDIFLGWYEYRCTGATATSFTGCSPHTACQARSGSLCGFRSGLNVYEGRLAVQGASFLRLKGFDAAFGVSAGGDSSNDVIFDGITSHSEFVSGRNVAIENSTLGHTNGAQTFYVSDCDHCVVYGNTITDQQNEYSHGKGGKCDASLTTNPHQSGNFWCHQQGIYLRGDTSFYLVGNHIYNNDSENIFTSYGATYNPGPLTIVNNLIGGSSVQINGMNSNTLSDYTIEGNSFQGSLHVQAVHNTGTVTFSNLVVSGNIIGGSAPCGTPPGVATWDATITNNLVSGEPCSSASSPRADGNLDLRGVTIAWPW